MPELRVLDFPAKPQKKEKKRRKYEMADGRFKAMPMINGVRHTLWGKSTKEVEEKIEKLKRELKGGSDPSLRNITVAEWAARWFETEMTGNSLRHQQGTQRQIDLIVKQIGGMKVRDVRLMHLNKTLLTRKGMSESQIDKMHNTITRIFRSARQNQIIEIDPAIDLKKPTGTYTGHRCLEPHEIDLLLNHWDCCNAGVWAVTMMLSGVRRGECLALRTDDFLFDKGVIRVQDAVEINNNKVTRKGKTKTLAGVRETPMLEPLTSILKKDFNENPRKDFVRCANGKHITESSFNSQWDTLMRRLTNIRAGYAPEKIPPKKTELKAEYKKKIEANKIDFDRHDLRHTFATFLYEAGVDEKTAMFYLGHTSPEMTRDLYAHLREEQMRRSDTKLHEYFKRFQPQKDDLS